MIAISFRTVVNIILISGCIISFIMYKVVCYKHKHDPEYQKRLNESMKEHAEEEKRIQKENDELDAYIMQDGSEYEDK